MRLHDMLNEATIDLQLEASGKIEVLRQLIAMLQAAGSVTDAGTFLEEVLEREALESTDMGIGVAIPHGRSPAVIRTAAAVARLVNPISWHEDLDEDRPVFAVFMLAVSDADEDRTHLELLSRLAVLLIEESFLADLSMLQLPGTFWIQSNFIWEK